MTAHFLLQSRAIPLAFITRGRSSGTVSANTKVSANNKNLSEEESE
jgi:hypothetical protein